MTTMMTVTSKGQVTLPAALMKVLKVKKGDKIVAIIKQNQVVLEPVGGGILDLVGTMPKLKIKKGQTVDDLVNEARNGYFESSVR